MCIYYHRGNKGKEGNVRHWESTNEGGEVKVEPIQNAAEIAKKEDNNNEKWNHFTH